MNILNMLKLRIFIKGLLRLVLSLYFVFCLIACSVPHREYIAKSADSETEHSSCSITSYPKKCTEIVINTLKSLKFLNPCLKYSKEKNMDEEFQKYSHHARKCLEKDRFQRIIKEAEYDSQKRSSELKNAVRDKNRPHHCHEIRIQEKISIPITTNNKNNTGPTISP